MARSLRCLLLFVFSNLLGPLAHAQERNIQDARSDKSAEQPLVLLNSTLIIGLSAVAPDDIKQIQIYKENNRPSRWLQLGLGTYGIVDIASTQKLCSKRFGQLARSLHVHGPVNFALNGQQITGNAAKLKIATNAIGRVEVQPGTLANSSTTISIWTALLPPVVHQPDTILIRGTSQHTVTPPAAAR